MNFFSIFATWKFSFILLLNFTFLLLFLLISKIISVHLIETKDWFPAVSIIYMGRVCYPATPERERGLYHNNEKLYHGKPFFFSHQHHSFFNPMAEGAVVLVRQKLGAGQESWPPMDIGVSLNRKYTES